MAPIAPTFNIIEVGVSASAHGNSTVAHNISHQISNINNTSPPIYITEQQTQICRAILTFSFLAVLLLIAAAVYTISTYILDSRQTATQKYNEMLECLKSDLKIMGALAQEADKVDFVILDIKKDVMRELEEIILQRRPLLKWEAGSRGSYHGSYDEVY